MFARFPQLYGADSPDQRALWELEVLWAITLVDSRAYGGRFPGDTGTTVPLMDCHNHIDRGSENSYLLWNGGEIKTREFVWGYGKLTEQAYSKVQCDCMLRCLSQSAFMLT